MIVEERRYTFLPGKLQVFLQCYAEQGMAVQRQYLRHLLGYYVSEVGPLNQITALWGYPSFAAREQWRAQLFADPRWTAFLQEVRPLMTQQECRILKAAPFFEQTLSNLLNTDFLPGEDNENSTPKP
jgi:hypothetical protein